ncbi:uncharacterized protein B0I36DRAFT_337215 [Microdochium trichocladiopsis]|uniref:Uncharacterized protein n=1 Tax=Microdochium trichocladiopsis TaxID=1682393 RepID=A0A9P8XTI6_9PEZI|nr:uncharacterized protein B0I36DRAFT_337215 [Microdochium trichocladiopsis]KAH7016294.1 hypothetical protein B0I36DRAFT_337215 [Microdochium trichocladiopsis]
MSGLTDEAAVEGHDLIQHVEEEAQMRPREDTKAGQKEDAALESTTAGQKEDAAAREGATAGQKEDDAPRESTTAGQEDVAGVSKSSSKIDSIREALHLKK